jgi:hypothetical protein
MQADHSEICKFEGEDSSRYKQAIHHIERLVQTAIRESRGAAEGNISSDSEVVLTTRDFGERLVLLVCDSFQCPSNVRDCLETDLCETQMLCGGPASQLVSRHRHSSRPGTEIDLITSQNDP